MPGQGSFGWFDGVQATAPSEYDERYGTAIDTLQLHHATMTSLSGLISMMQPGGRDVSANGAMGNDGLLIEVVPALYRAYTSASSYDRRCVTVECCNTTLSPDWGISLATHERAARLAVDMYRSGKLGGLNRRFIIGHNEVPGTYATACPGPSYNIDYVVNRAIQIYNGVPPIPVSLGRTPTMHIVEIVKGSGNFYLSGEAIGGPAKVVQLDPKSDNNDKKVLELYIKNPGGWDFTQEQYNTIRRYETAVAPDAASVTLTDAQLAAIIAGMPKPPSTAEIAVEVRKILAPDFDAVPTAPENGAAARTAIVK